MKICLKICCCADDFCVDGKCKEGSHAYEKSSRLIQYFCFVILTVQKIKRTCGGSSFLMKDMKNICKVALVQAEPILFDKEASKEADDVDRIVTIRFSNLWEMKWHKKS